MHEVLGQYVRMWPGFDKNLEKLVRGCNEC